jgi:hypothetical protein
MDASELEAQRTHDYWHGIKRERDELQVKVKRLCAIIGRCVAANQTGDYYNDAVWKEAAEAAKET